MSALFVFACHRIVGAFPFACSRPHLFGSYNTLHINLAVSLRGAIIASWHVAANREALGFGLICLVASCGIPSFQVDVSMQLLINAEQLKVTYAMYLLLENIFSSLNRPLHNKIPSDERCWKIHHAHHPLSRHGQWNSSIMNSILQSLMTICNSTKPLHH